MEHRHYITDFVAINEYNEEGFDYAGFETILHEFEHDHEFEDAKHTHLEHDNNLYSGGFKWTRK